MDDTQRIVKCGNLALHVPGGFFKKRWHTRYLVLYDGSKSGVKRLELFESEIKFKKQSPAKIIALVDCVRVVTCQRQKTTYTFEVRTSDQFYLLAAQSFQDMNDWVNCLRLVAFGQPAAAVLGAKTAREKRAGAKTGATAAKPLDVLLEARATPPQPPVDTHPALITAAAAASALAKARQRQPSLLGSCKPQPPTDSPFIRTAAATSGLASAAPPAQPSALDTLTPAVRGQLIAAGRQGCAAPPPARLPAALDEEEENMLYCSIEDNPSEHNYRVKVIETELSLRCQLKCYQLTAPNTVCQQYEQLGHFQATNKLEGPHQVTFYQLIVGPQELTLLNDYQALRFQQQSAHQNHNHIRHPQGLWSWPYQCIRRYGFDKDNCFMFEAGRKCGSGPGQFVVQTPKAYTIYQDVVKFVNELRSLGGTTTDLSNQQALTTAGRASVTQIPVTWAAPNSPPHVQLNPGTGPDTVALTTDSSTKRQFFDTLRQLDAGGIGAPVPDLVPKSASETTSNQQHPVTNNNNNATPSVASEETDESGYEQGDESVDGSSKSSSRASRAVGTTGGSPGGNLRKRQQVESMSSASSTSSSGAGSPGHSVSRLGTKMGGLNLNTGGQIQAKRTPLTTTNNQTSTNAAQKQQQQQPPPGKGKLGTMLNELVSDQPEDFEANLIRDVYSEITKLHAKFAVTTSAGSAEDSMSSRGHSSQEEEDEDEEDAAAAISEPMYSNLGRMGANGNKPVKNPKTQIDPSSRRRAQQQQQQRPRSSDPRYSQQQPSRPHQKPQGHHQDQLDPYLSSPPRPIYPTILNPIPECGEPTTATTTTTTTTTTTSCQSKTPTKTSHNVEQNIRRFSANNNNRGFNNKTTNETNNNGRLKPQQPSSSSSNGLLRSKLPTNHYVINDVQYAKISRNLYSKYESCL